MPISLTWTSGQVTQCMREVEPYTLIFVQDQNNLTFVLFTTVLPLVSLEGYSSTEVEQKVVNLSPSLVRGWTHQSHEKESSEQFAGIFSLYFMERDPATSNMHTAHSSGAQVLTPS